MSQTGVEKGKSVVNHVVDDGPAATTESAAILPERQHWQRIRRVHAVDGARAWEETGKTNICPVCILQRPPPLQLCYGHSVIRGASVGAKKREPEVADSPPSVAEALRSMLASAAGANAMSREGAELPPAPAYRWTKGRRTRRGGVRHIHGSKAVWSCFRKGQSTKIVRCALGSTTVLTQQSRTLSGATVSSRQVRRARSSTTRNHPGLQPRHNSHELPLDLRHRHFTWRCGAARCGDRIKLTLIPALTVTVILSEQAGGVVHVVLGVPAAERVAVGAGDDGVFADFRHLLRWSVLAADRVALAGSVGNGVGGRRWRQRRTVVSWRSKQNGRGGVRVER